MKAMRAIGWRVGMKNWNPVYDPATFLDVDGLRADIVMTLPEGVASLVSRYSVPRNRIFVVAHDEQDIQNHLKVGCTFDGLAGFGVVSDSLACSSLAVGVARVPDVLRLGIDFKKYRREPTKKLERVGYATTMSRTNIYGVERKRGEIAKRCADRAGLEWVHPVPPDKPVHKDSLPDHFTRFDALLMTSLSEGAGSPPLEAAATGRLVLGTPVGQFPRLAVEGVGLMGPLGAQEFEEWAVSELKFFAKRPASFRKQVERGQNAAENRDWSNVVVDWERFFLRGV